LTANKKILFSFFNIKKIINLVKPLKNAENEGIITLKKPVTNFQALQ